MKIEEESLVEIVRVLCGSLPMSPFVEVSVLSESKIRARLSRDEKEPALFREEKLGLSLQLSKDGASVAGWTENITESSLKNFVKNCFEDLKLALKSQEPWKHRQFFNDLVHEVSFVDRIFYQVPFEEKIQRLRNLSENARKLPLDWHRAIYEESLRKQWIWASDAKKTLYTERNFAEISLESYFEKQNSRIPIHQSEQNSHYYDLDWGAPVQQIKSVVSHFENTAEISSGFYSAVFTPVVGSVVWDAILQALRGDRVSSGRSQFKMSDLGKDITSVDLNLVLDPSLKRGVSTTAWDAEGTPTRFVSLIDRGRLGSFALNNASASTFQMGSNGCAIRSFGDAVARVGFPNAMIEPTNLDYVDLLKEMNVGLAFLGLAGTVSCEEVTGLLRIPVYGVLVEGGEQKQAVGPVLLKIRIKDFLKNLVRIGRDLKFRGSIGTPSVLCHNVEVIHQ